MDEDYYLDRPGRWEGYGQDFRSFYVAALILITVGVFLLADYIRHSQPLSPQSQETIQEAF